MGRIKRYKWLLIVLTMTVAFGGVAYAGYNVAVIASSPSDQWRACVSNVGVVRASTLRLNNYPPSCPVATDTVHSWNAVGPTGIAGATGNDGPNGPTGVSGPTGEQGLQASGPRTKLIYFPEVDVALLRGAPTNSFNYSFNAGAYSEPLTAVDTSECRSVSAHWNKSESSNIGVEVLDVEPISGTNSLLNFQMTSQSATGGAASRGYVSSYYWGLEWPTVDSGGSVGVKTSLRFRVEAGERLPETVAVTKAWLRCVPF